ncbi:MAG: iron-containing redox enzyme family protein [Myxococcales bacterium]
MRERHPLWDCRLLQACAAGTLTRDDFRYVFGQYYLYSRNFTRYLAGLLASCEDDYFRARLSENLWEEGGGAEPEQRHAEIFRSFLREGLGIEDLEAITFQDSTRYFVDQYLSFCSRESPLATAAFLSLGTEGIVSRLYEVLLAGLQRAGVAESHLRFFHLHIGCDDAHAETLEQMLVALADGLDARQTALGAMRRALDLRLQFFEALYAQLEQLRVQPLLDRIQARRSLAERREPGAPLVFQPGAAGIPLYENQHARLNIDFTVERLPLGAEVLDARVVRIPPGRNNENHKHAHETAFVVVSGSGCIVIEGVTSALKPGDVAFVPRWAFHQSHNTSPDEPLVLLAITDFGLTGRAFIGNYDATARLKRRAATGG